MRSLTILAGVVWMALVLAVGGCEPTKRQRGPVPAEPAPAVKPVEPVQTDTQPAQPAEPAEPVEPAKPVTEPAEPAKPAEPGDGKIVGVAPTESAAAAEAMRQQQAEEAAKREKLAALEATLTLESIPDNPTTRGGRGIPTLDPTHPLQPAVWIYVDGHEGHFVEEDGLAKLQWVIDQPVGPCPTFRVEAFEPLVPGLDGARFVLQRVDAEPEVPVRYAFAALAGTFEVGKDYDVCNLGAGFVQRKLFPGEPVAEIEVIEPLPPGPYLIAASVDVAMHGVQTGAVTFFEVKADASDAGDAPDGE